MTESNQVTLENCDTWITILTTDPDGLHQRMEAHYFHIDLQVEHES